MVLANYKIVLGHYKIIDDVTILRGTSVTVLSIWEMPFQYVAYSTNIIRGVGMYYRVNSSDI